MYIFKDLSYFARKRMELLRHSISALPEKELKGVSLSQMSPWASRSVAHGQQLERVYARLYAVVIHKRVRRLLKYKRKQNNKIQKKSA